MGTISFPSMQLYNTLSFKAISVNQPANLPILNDKNARLFSGRMIGFPSGNISGTDWLDSMFLDISGIANIRFSIKFNVKINFINRPQNSWVRFRLHTIRRNLMPNSFSEIVRTFSQDFDDELTINFDGIMENPVNGNINYRLSVEVSNGVNANISLGTFFDATTISFTSKSITMDDYLTHQFGTKYNYIRRDVEVQNGINYAFVSGDMICGFDDAMMTIKPIDLLDDFCKANGYYYYMDLDGTFNLKPIETPLNQTAIHFDICRHPEFTYAQGFVFNGVQVGYDSPSINYPLFRQQFAEVLIYSNENRGGYDMYDLVCKKLRVDYAGILLTRYEYENTPKRGSEQKRYKDVWLVQIDDTQNPVTPLMRGTTTNLLGGGVFNVWFSPRRVLERYKDFLSIMFGVFAPNRLNLSAQENTQNQMESSLSLTGYSDSFTEKADIASLGTPAFTPMLVTFDTLGKIQDIQKFQRITFDYNGERFEAIVKEVETTKRLEELQITAFLTEKVPT